MLEKTQATSSGGNSFISWMEKTAVQLFIATRIMSPG